MKKMIKKIFKKVLSFIKTRKTLVVVSLVLLIIGLFVGNSLFTPKKPKYQAALVEKKDLSSIVSASGKVKSDEEATLKFQTSGNLAWIGVKQWDRVSKWQAVACLDKEKLQKELEQELLDYMNERWDHEELMEHTYKDQALTEVIRIAKDKSQFDLTRVVLDVEISNIAIKYACLVAPIDGIVTEITAPHVGTNIYSVSDEIVISNPDKAVFSANVDEVDIGRVKKGMMAKVVLDAYPEEEINSLVEEVEFSSTVTSGGGTAFAVTFSLPPNTEGEKFKLGMNGDVEILTERKAEILVVPFEAIQESDDLGEYVWVVKNGQPEKQAIKVGISNDLETQILEGLNAGDQIVISGFKTLEKNHR